MRPTPDAGPLIKGNNLMATTNDQVTTPTAGGFSFHGSPGWLSRRRGLVVGAAVAAAGAAGATGEAVGAAIGATAGGDVGDC